MVFKGNCPTIRIYGCGLNVVVFSLNIIEIGKGQSNSRAIILKNIYINIYIFVNFLTHNSIKLKNMKSPFLRLSFLVLYFFPKDIEIGVPIVTCQTVLQNRYATSQLSWLERGANNAKVMGSTPILINPYFNSRSSRIQDLRPPSFQRWFSVLA